MMQKYVRGHLARKKHQPRLKGLVKIRAVRSNMAKMEEIANQLKKEKDVMLKQVKDIQQAIEIALKTIKTDPKITAAAIDKLYADIMAKVETQMGSMKIKLNVRIDIV
jgi:myosin VI